MLGRWGRTAAVGVLSVSLMVSVQGGVVLATAAPAVAAPPPAASTRNAAADKAAELASAPVTLPPPAAPEPAPLAPAVIEPPELSALERAKSKARADRADVIVEEMTTDRSRTTAHPDGTLETEVSAAPVRFKEKSGAWRDLDMELVTDGGKLRPKAAPASAPRLAGTTGKGTAVEFGEGEGLFTWTLEGASPGRAARSAGQGRGRGAAAVTYDDVLSGGRDLELQVTSDRVKESVILPDREVALASPSYVDVFTVPARVRARQGDQGVEFVDVAGTVVASFGGGHAFDSSRDQTGEPAMAPVATVLLGQTGLTVRVQVGVDPVWIGEPSRVFPVTVDPDFYGNTAGMGHDAYVDQSFPTTPQGSNDPGVLKTGLRQDYGASESLLWFDLPEALESEGNNVLSSQLSIFSSFAATCVAKPLKIGLNAATWQPNLVTWNNDPGFFGAPVVQKSFSHGRSGCPGDWVHIDVRPLVQKWSNDGWPNEGFRLYSDDPSWEAHKKFLPEESGGGSAPALRVTWENCELVPGGPNGAKRVCGAIRDTWRALGAETWGLPATDETPMAGGAFNHFSLNGVQDRSIYWHPQTGAKRAIHLSAPAVGSLGAYHGRGADLPR